VSPWSPHAKQVEALRPSPHQAAITVDVRVPPGGNITTVIRPLQDYVHAHVRPPLQAHLAGIPSLGTELNESSIHALRQGELIAAPILIVVLLLVFRSPVAAAIPLIMGQGTVFAAFGVISIILDFASLDAISLSLASGVGLALGVDYSLLIITRFREALDDGMAPRQAASLAANTARHAVARRWFARTRRATPSSQPFGSGGTSSSLRQATKNVSATTSSTSSAVARRRT
jgi:RND superfamily putative drug exporter